MKILRKEILNENVRKIVIEAPLVSKKAKPGQFCIVKTAMSERIPLTIHEAKDETISLIYQVVGASTKLLDQVQVNEEIELVGPLGEASHLDGYKKALVIGGGLGTAISYPIAKYLSEVATVTSVNGFRTKDLVILEKEFNELNQTNYTCTDDGSYGFSGLVTEKVKELILEEDYDLIFIVGPLIMMKYVYETVKNTKAKILVSMNPVMIDGTGMCGGCRLTVNGKPKFACVDGPDFDAREIDFDEAILRSKAYQAKEREAYEKTCNLLKKGEN